MKLKVVDVTENPVIGPGRISSENLRRVIEDHESSGWRLASISRSDGMVPTGTPIVIPSFQILFISNE